MAQWERVGVCSPWFFKHWSESACKPLDVSPGSKNSKGSQEKRKKKTVREKFWTSMFLFFFFSSTSRINNKFLKNCPVTACKSFQWWPDSETATCAKGETKKNHGNKSDEPKKHVVQRSCDSSVGRASDWRSKGPVFDPRLQHHFWKLH